MREPQAELLSTVGLSVMQHAPRRAHPFVEPAPPPSVVVVVVAAFVDEQASAAIPRANATTPPHAHAVLMKLMSSAFPSATPLPSPWWRRRSHASAVKSTGRVTVGDRRVKRTTTGS
jgi:hypothetical protein